jgi:hypothetical protein
MDGGEATGDRSADKAYGADGDGQDCVDRSKIDFDPAAGLYTGTAVAGTSEIPGPHETEGTDGPDETRETRETDDAHGAADPRPS